MYNHKKYQIKYVHTFKVQSQFKLSKIQFPIFVLSKKWQEPHQSQYKLANHVRILVEKILVMLFTKVFWYFCNNFWGSCVIYNLYRSVYLWIVSHKLKEGKLGKKCNFLTMNAGKLFCKPIHVPKKGTKLNTTLSGYCRLVTFHAFSEP